MSTQQATMSRRAERKNEQEQPPRELERQQQKVEKQQKPLQRGAMGRETNSRT